MQIAPQPRVHMKRARIDRLVDPYPLYPGIVTGRIEMNDDATGMMLPDQGTAHILCDTEPFTLHIFQAAGAQLGAYLRMTVAGVDSAPLRWYFELFAQGYRVHRQQQRPDQQECTTQDS